MIKNIIIVDDHQLFLDGLVSLLSRHKDINIIKATTSINSAFDAIKKSKPHLVISDISMPKMNGIEFISKLKKTHPSLKIMVLSMFANLHSYKNIDAYLLKETSEDELIFAINEVVKNNKKYLKIAENKEENINLYQSNILLTIREKEIIKLIINEFNTTEISEKLFISKHTVMTHRKNIFFKLEVTNIAGLTKKAFYLGIV
ncbi:MAG: response regulator transcription factor [Flavobacteriaceae bacterium]|nr:response regulator transcription factor [Flavobacteriaceae bacterium]